MCTTKVCALASHAVDGISMEEMDRLANEPRSVVISCNLNLNLDYLVERIWEELKLLRIYTKKRGEHPDLTDPIVVRRGATIEHVVRTSPLTPVSWRASCAGRQVCLVRIMCSPQRDGVWQIQQVRFSCSPRFPLAQKVGLNHLVANDDVVTIFTRTFAALTVQGEISDSTCSPIAMSRSSRPSSSEGSSRTSRPVLRYGLLALAVVAAAVAILVSRDQWHMRHARSLMDILDDPIEALQLSSLKYDSLVPKDLRKNLEDILTKTSKWSETIDFQVGWELAKQGAKPEHPVVLIPGIVSTGLESWTTTDEESAYFRRRLWGSTSMLRSALFDKEKWVKHLMLDPETGLDPEGIRVRAAQGLDAASYFAAGYWVWSKIIENLAAVGYDINQIYLAGYDWRLSMYNLEERDHFFTRIVTQVEMNKKIFGKKTVLISHSMGGTVAFYFLKWAEYHLGAAWIDKNVEALVSISGTLLGVPKAMPALMTGEMRDTVQVPAMLANLLESFFSSRERAQLFRSWAGSASMLVKGGDVVWGNADGAPDDMDNATVTHGVMMEYQPKPDQNVSTKLTVSGVHDWLRQNAPKAFENMLATNYSYGFERSARQIRKNNADFTKWSNPLEAALPEAPHLKVYCLYGYNQPTERSYWMHQLPPDDEKLKLNPEHPLMTQSLNNGSNAKSLSLSRIDASVTRENEIPAIKQGVRMGEGDGTVSLLSLGAMCVEGWKHKRYNPANIKVVTHEVFHDPAAFDLRGGGSSGDHIDILGSHELNDAVVRVATGLGHTVEERILSPIRTYAARIAW